VNKALLVRETGWTLHYVEEELDAREIYELLEIYDAVDRAVAFKAQRRTNTAVGSAED
jgi:hypothetical protein